MKKIATSILLILSTFLMAQDTIIVQTLTYDSTSRNYMFGFPADDGTTYEKVLMEYSMRCKDGLVSTSADRNKGCGEWDYSCNTYIRDSSLFDSNKAVHPSHIISNFSGDVFNYTVNPAYDYYRYTQKKVSYTDTTSIDSATVGTGNELLTHPFRTENKTSKSQYLWTASELSTAGLNAGNITGLKIDVNTIGTTEIKHLRVKLKHTSASTLDDFNPDLDGFTEVYYLNIDIVQGLNTLDFYTNFNWNGTSNILIEISYTNVDNNNNTIVLGHDAGADLGLITLEDDYVFNLNGSTYLDLGSYPSITEVNPRTIELWSKVTLFNNAGVFQAGANGTIGADFSLRTTTNNNDWRAQLWGDPDFDFTLANSYNQWHHYAMVYTGSSILIYYDGQLAASNNASINTILHNLFVGYWNGSLLQGSVDDVRIWNTNLSQLVINDWKIKDVDSSHPNYSNLKGEFKLNANLNDTYTSFKGTIKGDELWKMYRGNEINKGFKKTSLRPNLTFVQGVYTSSVSNVTVYDTVESTPNRVIEYQVSGSDIIAYDTQYVWSDGYEYLFDSNGNKLDSFSYSTPSIINITNLNYYLKSPMDFELMSFVTPYGIGLDFGLEGKTWTFDVTDFEPILHGNKRLFMTGGIFQEEMDIRFKFIKGTPTKDVLDIRQIWKVQSRNHNQIIANEFFEPKEVKLITNGDAFKIRTAITGHGQEGEFIPRNHYINIDGGNNELEWSVWKECSDNPVFPQGGTWIFDRAGWCPGEPTDVKDYYISASGGDNVNVDYGLVNGASGDSRYFVNSQLVTYGEPNFSLDVAILDVMRPSKKVEYTRENPACQEPIVIIQNNGTTDLTSLDFTYKVAGGIEETYTWSGNLEFLKTDTVYLPIGESTFWYSTTGVDEFQVSISNVNGSSDEYSNNNTYKSKFDRTPRYYGPVEVFLLTNKFSYETSYTLKNIEGDTLLIGEQYDLLSLTEYRDELTLPVGCYSLEVRDDIVGNNGQNGLEFWFYPNFGSGVVTLRDSTQYNYLESDFGAYIKYDFSMGDIYTSSIPEGVDYQLFNIYPNPVNDVLYVKLHGFHTTNTKIEIYNSVGKLMYSRDNQLNPKSISQIDISNFIDGIYYIKIEGGNQIKTRKFVKN